MQLSSSIVHIDENDSDDDEYLDAEAYTTANSTVEDEDAPSEQPAGPGTAAAASELAHPNLVNSSSNSYNAISSNLFFSGLRGDEPFENFTAFAHNSDHSELSNPHQSQSSCKSSLLIRTTTPVTTSTVTASSNFSNFSNSNFSNSNFSESSSQKLNKCHCRLVQASFTAKQRPLSLSSISSSSSSCCSLSRNNSLGGCQVFWFSMNCMVDSVNHNSNPNSNENFSSPPALSDHLKKPYLASIESLGDDELPNSNVNKFQLGHSDEHSSSGISSGCHSGTNSSTEPSVHSTCSCCVLRSGSNLSLVRSASTNSNQSTCGCRGNPVDHNNLDAYEQDYCSAGANGNGKPESNDLIYRSYQHSSMNQQNSGGVHTLSQLDRVIMEIVQTESAYVKDLNEIIEVGV